MLKSYSRLPSIPEIPSQLSAAFTVQVLNGTGDEMACQVTTDDTFGTLKTQIEQRWRTPAVLQQIFTDDSDEPLPDHGMLCDYGIVQGACLIVEQKSAIDFAMEAGFDKENCHLVTDGVFEDYIDQNADIQNQLLSLDGCAALSDHSLDHIAKKCPEILGLNLRRCPGFSNEGLENVLRHCKKLTVLFIGGNDWVSDSTIRSIALHCSQIQRLDVCGCFEVTDTELNMLMGRCKQICFFNMAFTSVSQTAHEAMSSHYPHIEIKWKQGNAIELEHLQLVLEANEDEVEEDFTQKLVCLMLVLFVIGAILWRELPRH